MPTVSGTSIAIVVGHGTTFQPPVKPPACFTDTFTRTVAAGWGTADNGLVWGQYGGATATTSSRVNGAAGYVDGFSGLTGNEPTANVGAQPYPIDVTFDVLFTTGTNNPSPGLTIDLDSGARDLLSFDLEVGPHVVSGPVYLYSDVTNAYGQGFDLMSSGTVDYIGPGFDPTQWVSVRIRCEQTNVYARAWYRGQAEPANWPMALLGVDFSNFTFGSADLSLVEFFPTFFVPGTLPPYTFAIDNLAVNCGNASVAPFDMFNRTVASGWGTSTDGHVWSVVSPSNVTASVDGANGVLTASGSLGYSIDMRANSPGPWDSAFTEVTRIYQPPGTAEGWSFYRTVVGSGNTLISSFFAPSPSAALTLQLGDNTSSSTFATSITRTPGAAVLIKWQNDGTVLNMKAWADGTTEPSGWQLSYTLTAGLGTGSYYDVNWSSGYPASTMQVDYITFSNP